MAYTEERKIWLDKDGKVLVDKDGKPFYTISCCCGSTCCWQLYEASCVDANGVPGWTGGSNNAAATEPRHWTTPQLANYTCTTDCAGTLVFEGALGHNAGDREGRWVLFEPGTAYYGLKRSDIPVCSILHVDEQGNSSWEVPCSRPVAFVPPPDIPCSCELLDWGEVNVRLPYVEYINMVFAVSTMYNKEGGNLSTCIGSSLFSVWDMPAGLPCSNTYKPGAVWYDVRKRTQLSYSYMNCMPVPLLDKAAVYHGPSCSTVDAYSSNFYLKGDVKEWLMPYFKQFHTSRLHANAYNGLDGVETSFGYGRAAFGFPFNTAYMFTENDHNKMWASNLSVFTLGKLPDDTWGSWCVGSIVESQLSADYVATCYATSHWSCVFDRDQWGSLIVSAGAGNATLHWVREAVGADCAYPDTPTVTGAIKPGEQVVLDGSPTWLYRTYFTTELPLDDINDWNRHCIARTDFDYPVEDLTIPPDRVRFSFNAQAMKCPQYNFLLCVQGQNCCFNDPPNLELFGLAPETDEAKDTKDETGKGDSQGQGTGSEQVGETGPCCAPYYHKEYVIRGEERKPAGFIWAGDSTYLMHEAEESVDENGNTVQGKPFRVFNSSKDGHLYYIRRLSIDNYPRWKTDNLCINSLNANLYDVPKVDFSYDAQLCVNSYVFDYPAPPLEIESSGCYYPETNLRLDDRFLEHKYTDDGFGVLGHWQIDRIGSRSFVFLPRSSSFAKRQADIMPVVQLCESAYGQECTTSLVSVFKAINTKVSTYQNNVNGEVRNETYCEFDISDWWKNGKGCPNYSIGAVRSLKLEKHEYRPTAHYVHTQNDEKILGGVYSAVKSHFMWEGRVLDPYVFPDNEGKTMYHGNSFSAYPVTSRSHSTTFVTSLLDGGVYFYQKPDICCPPDNNDNDGDI